MGALRNLFWLSVLIWICIAITHTDLPDWLKVCIAVVPGFMVGLWWGLRWMESGFRSDMRDHGWM